MPEYCMIEIAFDNLELLNELVKALLSQKLIASAHVIESASSWLWHGAKEQAHEYLLQVKTKKKNQSLIYDIVKEKHNYDIFELVVYDISSVSNDYLKWLDEEII